MHHEKLPAILRCVHRAWLDVDIGVVTREIGDVLVVIAGNVDNRGSLAAFAKDFLDDIAMLLIPEDPALHGPEINQITDDIEGVAFKSAQETEESPRLTASRPEMDVGDPNAPVVIDVRLMHKIMCSLFPFRNPRVVL
jgi:hypothetical protein